MNEHYNSLIEIYNKFPMNNLVCLKEQFEKNKENSENLQAIRYVIANREFYDEHRSELEIN